MSKLIAVTAVLLAACSSGPWSRLDGSSNMQDFTDCRYDAEVATAPMREGIDRALRRNELEESCLRKRGYAPGAR